MFGLSLRAARSLLLLPILVACGSPRSVSWLAPSPTPSASQIPQQARTKQSCEYPELLKAAEDAGDVVGLLDHLKGKYVLEAVHVFAYRPSVTGSLGRSLYATLSDTNALKTVCSEATQIDDPLIVVNALVPRTIFAPSQRVTVFDENEGTFDHPDYNYPTLIELSFSSNGNHSLILAQGSAPYTKNLTLGEVISSWPVLPKTSVRTDGKAGFQLFYNANSSGQQPQNSSVLFIYAPST